MNTQNDLQQKIKELKEKRKKLRKELQLVNAEIKSAEALLSSDQTMPIENFEPSNEFDGYTFNSELDSKRLSSQLIRVRDLMLDQKWRTLPEIEKETGYPQGSISARLRDLRKEKFGSYRVQSKRRLGGVWEYLVLAPI